MFSARQLLLMRRARDGAVGVAIAPIGTVVLLFDPDFRRRVFRCDSHVGLAFVAWYIGRMNRVASVGCPFMVVGVVILCGGSPPAYPKKSPPLRSKPRVARSVCVGIECINRNTAPNR